MTNYSGIQLVKQESCKLTYATFLSNVIVCYDRVANELVLNNPYFFETVYDDETKTLSNSAFSLRKVDFKSSFGSQFIIGLDLDNTGLELILYADSYSRKQIIPYRHLAICDSLPCYDLDDYPDNLPYCKTAYYTDPEGKQVEVWPCTGASREFPITSIENITIQDDCPECVSYDFSKTFDRELFYTEKVIYNDKEVWPSFEKNKEYNSSNGKWIEGGPTVGVFQFLDDCIVITDPKYIVDTCLKDDNKISTINGCKYPYIKSSPCDIATDAMSYNQIPLIDFSFGSLYKSIGQFDTIIIKKSGEVTGKFYGTYDQDHLFSIKLFNIYDYIQPRSFKENEGKPSKEVLIWPFIFYHYINFDGSSTPPEELNIDPYTLSSMFTSLESATFNWTKKMPKNSYLPPCYYKTIEVFNTQTETTVKTTYIQDHINAISINGLDGSGIQEAYDAFCNKVKWLISKDAFVYAIDKGKLFSGETIYY